MRKILFIGMALFISHAFFSCDGINPLTGCGGDYDFIYDNNLIFHVLDKNTKQDLLVIG